MSSVLLTIHLCSAVLSVLRIITYERNGARYRFFASLYAFALVVTFGLIATSIISGTYGQPHPLEVTLNVVMCGALYAVRGNVARLWPIGLVREGY